MADIVGLLAAATALAGTPAQGASVERPVTVAAATRACVEATSPSGVDEARLGSAGWDGYDIGLGAENGMRVYNHGRGPIILAGIGTESRQSGCNVIAPLPAGSSFETVVTALSNEFRAQPTGRKPDEVIWVMGDKGILLTLTGGKTRPAVRATVVQNAEGMK